MILALDLVLFLELVEDDKSLGHSLKWMHFMPNCDGTPKELEQAALWVG